MSERLFILRAWAKAIWQWLREPQTNGYREMKRRQTRARRDMERELWRRS